ncbi:MAG: hypothetical protein WCG96_09250 [Actinomycetes bacterium]
MTTSRHLHRSAALLVVGLALAGCSSGGGTAAPSTSTVPATTTSTPAPVTTTTTPSTGRTVTMTLSATGFSPFEVFTVPGDHVEFTNHLDRATRIHFTNLGGDGDPYSPSIEPGGTWTYSAPYPRSIIIAADGVSGRPGRIQVTVP